MGQQRFRQTRVTQIGLAPGGMYITGCGGWMGNGDEWIGQGFYSSPFIPSHKWGWMEINFFPNLDEQIRIAWLTQSTNKATCWAIEMWTFLTHWVPGWSSLQSLYGHKEHWSVFSGFVLDEKYTRFCVVAPFKIKPRSPGSLDYFSNTPQINFQCPLNYFLLSPFSLKDFWVAPY